MKFLDISAQYADPELRQEIDQAIKRVVDQGAFIGGQEVQALEKEIAEFCGVENAVGVNSGTDALFLALKALEIGKGDEVITTPFTFISTAEVIVNAGAKPVFVDIDEDTFNIDPEKIEEKITERTKAIIPVHLFGQMVKMDRIMDIAKKHRLYVIEDAAQAIGAEFNGKKSGSFGDCGCFSFFPSKNMGCFGDGGMIVSQSPEVAEKLRLLRNHGSSSKEKYLNLISGTNSRLDSLQAVVLRVKFKYLEDWNKKRFQNALYYNNGLADVKSIKLPTIFENQKHIFNQYTLMAENRDSLLDFLSKNGVPTMIYYPLPLHLQPAFAGLDYKAGHFKNAENAAKKVFSLPIYPEFKESEQDEIIVKIKEFYGRKS